MPFEDSLAEIRAREIIRDFRIKHADQINVESIAFLKGVLVDYQKLEGAEGRLVRKGEKGIIRVSTDVTIPGKKRFVIAHELGHFLIHQDRNQLALCTDRDMLFWYRQNSMEYEANLFAAELLMPEDLFKSKCDSERPGLDIVETLADEFQTTFTATALRYIKYCPHRCALVVSEDRRIKWTACHDFFYKIERGTELHPYTFAMGFFEGEELPEQIQQVRADAWIKGRKIDSTTTIYEHSKPLPRYNTVITLLWIDDPYL